MRWSPSGDFLASGSDDKRMIVWHRIDAGVETQHSCASRAVIRFIRIRSNDVHLFLSSLLID